MKKDLMLTGRRGNMEIVKSYLQSLFEKKGVSIPLNRINLFEEFKNSQLNEDAVNKIYDIQNRIIENWKLKNRIEDVIVQHVSIPNATVNKPYMTTFNLEELNFTDLYGIDFDGISILGLSFNKETKTIEGTPLRSGEFIIKLIFNVEGENENESPHEKKITFIVNPDPKTLWKDIPSDKSAIFSKKDDEHDFCQLGEKHIVVASKRGRSHKNVGSFRDDDFAFKYYVNNGWSIVAVADGAGSYALSRQGSRIACNTVIDYFEKTEELNLDREFEQKIQEFIKTKNELILKEIEVLSKQILYKATTSAHNRIRETAIETSQKNPELFNNPKAKNPIEYFHTTLIFALFKRYKFGYIILTFGVGDCPIAVINKNLTETFLLNWLDVGEFGGGTRFITQSDIFHSTEHPMSTRFNFCIISDFSYLFLMSDGIYDPKFVVEANLEKHEKWMEFVSDLQGNNEDNAKVEFIPNNSEIENQLLRWLDFWSPGNHDDRTLAVIF